MQASEHQENELTIAGDAPAWRELPAQRSFSPQFTSLRPQIYEWIEDYYDRDHLTRAGDWMLALAPDAPEYLVVAALLHDLERKVPGGPWLDLATDRWDDRAYNDAHTGRSAVVVATWLTANGCDKDLALAVAQPIREHEFGGSPDGDLMQAADSISFLETNAPLVSGWANRGKCTPEKALEKLRWMGERVRHPEGSRIARRMMERAIEQFDRELERER
jgi:hypothetical protein